MSPDLHLPPPLHDWLEDVCRDPVYLDPSDITGEARKNQWSFSLTMDEATKLTAADVVSFVLKVCDARSRALHERAAEAVFYCWHDLQAGQLRLSLVSATHESLPFGRRIVPADLESIAASWLTSEFLAGVPGTNLQPVTPGDPSVLGDETVRIPELRVWQRVIPGGPSVAPGLNA